MTFKLLHPWNIDLATAKKLQIDLAKQVMPYDHFESMDLVAGVDLGYDKIRKRISAVVVTLDTETLQIIEKSIVIEQETFLYVPGYLSFREVPPIIKALEKLNKLPDLIVCDGQGYAHPRRFGVACHLGVLTGIPTIGCGKTRLIGEYTEPGLQKGQSSSLMHNEERIGTVLRTRTNTRPLFISHGHKISLQTAEEWILKLCPKYRLPETTRLADKLAKSQFKDILL